MTCIELEHSDAQDIKPENFLCVGRGTELKICDFGLALKQPKKGKLTGVGGTAPYMAPETLVKPKGLWAKPGFHKEALGLKACFEINSIPCATLPGGGSVGFWGDPLPHPVWQVPLHASG